MFAFATYSGGSGIHRRAAVALVALALGFAACGPAPVALVQTAPAAAVQEVNLYSSRHYDRDQELYAAFAAATGIRVNEVQRSADALVQAIRTEGSTGPADVILMTDAGSLERLATDGRLSALPSTDAIAAVDARLRDPEGQWVGLARRARVLVYNPGRVAVPPASYTELADPRFNGEICVRSSSNTYNLSLMAALIQTLGEPAAEAWAQGVVANFAAPPRGNDTDNIRDVAAGTCGITLANHYYLVRLSQSAEAGDIAAVGQVKWVLPTEAAGGTAQNATAVGIAAHAPNRAAAEAFVAFLLSVEGQRMLAQSVFEFPVNSAAMTGLPALLAGMDGYAVQPVELASYGALQPAAQLVFERAGWR
jgi:iron(III) transport system substrate-binding protein